MSLPSRPLHICFKRHRIILYQAEPNVEGDLFNRLHRERDTHRHMDTQAYTETNRWDLINRLQHRGGARASDTERHGETQRTHTHRHTKKDTGIQKPAAGWRRRSL